MHDDLTEQVEAPPEASVHALPRRWGWLLAATVAALVGGVAVGMAVSGSGKASAPVSTERDRAAATTSTSSVAAAGPTTIVDSAATTVASVTAGSRAPTAALPSPTTPPSPVTTTTEPLVGPGRITGSATWIGRDPRAALRVGACAATDAHQGCPSMISVPVADDGSFVLTLPARHSQWQVAAYVIAGPTCVFRCVWPDAPLNAVRSEVVTVDTTTEPSLTLTVSARVIDVVVRDRNGDPFEGGGVMVEDTSCQADPCPDDYTMMFASASSADGAARLVLDPNLVYDLSGLAGDTGWADPHWTSEDGTEFWFSPGETTAGADLDEGHVFYVDGAPSP